MTPISLRNYVREIEILIDQGRFDDAVKHCKHILKFYPKHIDTYRLMGKSFLENQKCSEAADIFLRVLSVIPDDFVAHIGMSLIREDEGNLDNAIWHIERAFEINPSNVTLQDEIRRLYGRRDGIHLSKIRLTRGALIRMYLQGELYNQAIMEARTAIAEDPSRIDLEVLLARLYHLSGRKVEAAETCAQIINKLPYCLEANKILSIILSSLNRSEEAKVFQRRIHALQPYSAHVSKNAPSVQHVPDNAIMLEKLNIDFNQQVDSSQPDWAKTIGVEVDANDETLPEWLPSLREEVINSAADGEQPELDESTLSPQTEIDMDSLEFSQDDEIPVWMKAAGWRQKPMTEEGDEVQTFEEEQITNASEDLGDDLVVEKSDVPDWLKDLAPSDEEFDLENIKDENASTIENKKQVDFPLGKEDLDHKDPEETSGLKDPFEEIDEALDWLETNADDDSGKQASAVKPEDDKQNLLGEWVKEYDDSDLSEEREDAEDFSDLLQLEDEEIFEPDLTKLSAAVQKEHEPTSETQEIPEDADEDIEDAFAWLESLAAKQGADNETLSTRSKERSEDIPDWLKDVVDKNEDLEKIVSEADTRTKDSQGQTNAVESVQEPISAKAKMEDVIKTEIQEPNSKDEGDSFQTDSDLSAHLQTDVDQIQINTQAIEPSDKPLQVEKAKPNGVHFTKAKDAISAGDLDFALQEFSNLIDTNENLPEIIQCLENALITYPLDARIWQTLGDAYGRTSDLEKALEAYSKAEELLI